MLAVHLKLGAFIKAWTVLAFLGIYEILHTIVAEVAPKVSPAASALPWVTAGVPLLGIFLTWVLTRKKLDAIHVLVDGRMSEALKRIADVETKLSKLNPGDVVQARVAEAARTASADAEATRAVADGKSTPDAKGGDKLPQ